MMNTAILDSFDARESGTGDDPLSLKRSFGERFASGISLSRGKGDSIDIARALRNDNRERVPLRV